MIGKNHRETTVQVYATLFPSTLAKEIDTRARAVNKRYWLAQSFSWRRSPTICLKSLQMLHKAVASPESYGFRSHGAAKGAEVMIWNKPCAARDVPRHDSTSDLQSRTTSRQICQQVCMSATHPTMAQSRSLPAPLLDGFAPPTRKGDPWRRRAPVFRVRSKK